MSKLIDVKYFEDCQAHHKLLTCVSYCCCWHCCFHYCLSWSILKFPPIFREVPILWAHVSPNEKSETCFPAPARVQEGDPVPWVRRTVQSRSWSPGEGTMQILVGKGPLGHTLLWHQCGGSSARSWPQLQCPQERGHLLWGSSALQSGCRSWFQSHQTCIFALPRDPVSHVIAFNKPFHT